MDLVEDSRDATTQEGEKNHNRPDIYYHSPDTSNVSYGECSTVLATTSGIL